MLGAERERHRGAAGAAEVVLRDLGVLAGHLGRPLEDLVPGGAARPGLGRDPVVDLLEDPRHGRHVRGADDRQILDDLVDPAVHGDHLAGGDLPGGEHLAEDMRQRQPEVLHIVLMDQARRLNRAGHVRPAVVRQPDTLGTAGGTGGVDERGQLVGAQRGDPLLDTLRVLLQIGGAALLQLGEGEHPALRIALGGLRARLVDDDDMGQLGQLRALRAGLGELSGVLRDQHPAAGVGQDVGGLLGVGAGVDRGGGGAGAEHPEVGEDPLDAGVGGQRHPLLGAYAERDEPGGHGVDPLRGLGPADRLPVVRPLALGRGTGWR